MAECVSHRVSILSDRLSRDLRNLQTVHKEPLVIETSPVVPEFSGRMKKKAKSSLKVTPWTRFQYANKEGPGAMMLTHVRPTDDPNKCVNTFLKVNKAVNLQRYNDASYEAKLRSTAWTREETDELMRLAELIDARLVVMHDRWGPPFAPRTLEQIKHRFYEVQRLLSPDPKNAFVFDYDAAVKRKRHEEILYNRNGFEVWEEYEAKQEYEAVAAELAKAKAAPARARALMTALEHGVRESAMANSSFGSALNAKSESRKSDAWSPSDARGKAKKKTKSGSVADMSAVGGSGGSGQLPAAVDAFLRNDLAVPIRPSANSEAATAHSELRHCVMALLDMQVLQQQKQYEVEVLRAQLAALEQMTE